MEEKNKKRQVAKITMFITSIFVIFMSVTYAFINQTLTGTKEVVINAGVLDLVLEEENAITISDALPMHDAVGMIQEDVFKFRLVNKTSNLTNYILKLSKIDAANELSTSDVKYYLTKEGVGEPKLLSSLPLDGTVDSGTIAGSDTIDYTLRLWINSAVTDDAAISGKTLSYKIDVEASQKMVYVPATSTNELVDVATTGENCKTYDDGTDTFLVGQCSNNYVWYSGKLWRVVSQNNATGAIKMITDNSMTVLGYNVNENSNFANSEVDQWLSQEFLPTLHDTQDFLVENSVWDTTINPSNTPSKPTFSTTVTRTVGLLNTYEYYTTYNKSDGLATASTGYLTTEEYWYLITPSSSSKVYLANMGSMGGGLFSDITKGRGIRPVVNLKQSIKIISGTGIKYDPYILEGDIEELTGTVMLYTRRSGEYIRFNGGIYRLVGMERGSMKVTAVDTPAELRNIKFSSISSVTNFANSDIKNTLESYYQNMKNTDITSYNMIQPNMTWYLGSVAYNESYKKSICASVDINTSTSNCTKTTATTTSTIGLPRYGEMFTSHITRGEKKEFWTLTPYDSNTRINFIHFTGFSEASGPGSLFQARPSLYLKPNVAIATNKMGRGTYEYPYQLELLGQ